MYRITSLELHSSLNTHSALHRPSLGDGRCTSVYCGTTPLPALPDPVQGISVYPVPNLFEGYLIYV